MLQLLKRNSAILGLATSSVMVILIGFVTSLFLARVLTPEAYGVFFYITSKYVLVCTLSTLGFFYSVNRIILSETSRSQIKEWHGGGIVVLIVISTCVVLPYVFFSKYFSVGDGWLLTFLPVVGIPAIMILQYIETVSPSDGNIRLINTARLYPKLIFLLFVIGVYLFSKPSLVSEVQLLWINFFLSVSVCFYLINRHGLSFCTALDKVKHIFRDNFKYGIHVYIGSVFSVGGTAMAGVAVGYFSESKQDVAFYTLATNLTALLGIFPAAISTARYKTFYGLLKIDRRILITVFGVVVSLLLFIAIFSEWLVLVFWGREYIPMVGWIYLLSIAAALYAFADLLNRFLMANGCGKDIRNASFLVGGALILSTLVLAFLLGGVGVAYARIVAGMIYLFVLGFLYRKRILGQA